MLQTPTLHSKINFFISKHLTVSGLSALEQQSALECSSGKCYLFVQAISSRKMHIQYLLEPMGRGKNKVLYTMYSTPLITSSLAYYSRAELFIIHCAVSWMVQVQDCSGKATWRNSEGSLPATFSIYLWSQGLGFPMLILYMPCTVFRDIWSDSCVM